MKDWGLRAVLQAADAELARDDGDLDLVIAALRRSLLATERRLSDDRAATPDTKEQT